MRANGASATSNDVSIKLGNHFPTMGVVHPSFPRHPAKSNFLWGRLRTCMPQNAWLIVYVSAVAR